MEILRLDSNDNEIIRKALLFHKKTIGISTIINLIFFVGLKYAIKTTDNSHLPNWLLTLVPLIPLMVIINTIANYRYYILDIRKGEKLIFKSLCKKRVVSFDGDNRDYLWIENFKEIDMSGYNYENYSKYFQEGESANYEIHIAPKSEIILYLKKL